MSTPSDELPELRLEEVDEEPRPVSGLISAETERELRAAAEQLAKGARFEADHYDISMDVGAPPVFPGVMSPEPEPDARGSRPLTAAPVTPPPSDDALESLLTQLDQPADLRSAIGGTTPEEMGALLPSVVAPENDPLAPMLPLSMEEPPAVSRIAMEKLMPDPKALEALQKLAGAAGHPDRTKKALSNAITGGPYDPRHLPDARVMMVGIMQVLAAHGLPADEMVEAIMASLTD